MYGFYLGNIGLHVDENGHVDVDPDGGLYPNEEIDIDDEQQKYDDYVILLDAVKAKFEHFYYLNPGGLAQIVNDLGGKVHGPAPTVIWAASTVYDRLHYADDQWMRPLLGLIGGAGAGEDEVDWSGDAAQKFHDRILDPFHRVVEHQMACTRLLSVAAQAAHDGMVNVQDDLLALADAGVARFSGESAGGDASGFLQVVSFITGAISLFPSPASLPAGVISLATSVLATIEDGEESREWNITGVNATMILESIWENLLALDEEIDRKDGQMADALEQDLDNEDFFASPELRLEDAPDLDRPDAFGELQVDSVPGVPISDNKVVVTLVQLYAAGYRNLPSAAYQYEQATSTLVDPIPYSFRRLFHQTRSIYQQARAQLRGAVSATRWDLEGSGDALVRIATSYETTDERAAEVMRQIGDLAQPPHISLQSPGDNPVKAAARGAV